ncbi:CLIP-associating protein isoform X3 [Prorops nasuta]|uniref:CLIP-associating protein isoform X3 n=1 Tax=Prorops nasuta TaxID=863751 RepID=UPI0034CE26FC
MAVNPQSMDDFMPLLSTTEIKKKLYVGELMLNYLSDDRKSIECQDIGMFIDNVTSWLNNGNPKVVQNGLEILSYLTDRMGHDFKFYVSSIIQLTIDRLGDSKDTTREKAQFLLLKFTEKNCLTPQQLLDRLKPAFEHKNAKLREEALLLLSSILEEFGSDEMTLSGVTGSIVKLLSDPSEKVRETALYTMADIYKHVGDRLRVDLQKKHNVPQAKFALLTKKFDEIKANGELLPMATASNGGRDNDETDRAIKSAPVKRMTPSIKRTQFGPSKTPTSAQGLQSSHTGSSTIPRSTSVKRAQSVKSATGPAGAVDEETFMSAFEDVPNAQIYSSKDLEDQMKLIKDTVGDASKDWKQKTDSIKKLRAIIIAGGPSHPNFTECLKTLYRPFDAACQDLRSQVVREACITLAYLSQQLKRGFDGFGEAVLNTLLNLIQNSAKVVASAGAVAVRFILKNTHNHRFVPIITTTLNHKSKDIRRASCELLALILQTWSTPVLQKHIGILQDAMKKGIADSDPEARAFARKSYWAFKEHFPEQAEIVLNSLDAHYKRSLMSLSNSGSTNNLNAVARSTSISPRSARPAMSAAGSTENLHQIPGPLHGPLRRTPSLPRSYRQSGIPILQRPTDNHYRVTPSVRSTSAIDLKAAQRAKVRIMFATMNRQKAAALPRPNKSPDTAALASPERVARTRTRVSGTSQSQPNSRSGSPSSRLNYVTYQREGDLISGRPRRLSGHGVPSTSNSREPSPQRYGIDRGFSSKLRSRITSAERPSARPVMAQKILQQSREAESALADALPYDSIDNYTRTPRGKGDHSDDSETSSVASDRSIDGYRRSSDSYSWSGSHQRLYREMWDQPVPKDIKEIIDNCAHKHWAERKDGLMGLQYFLANGNTLSASELRTVTDIFIKMFMDSHTKVFSLFLDTLSELITTHNEDLGDWLYVLCAKLLNKLGTDLLGSIQTKVYKTLDIVRESFSGAQLLPVVMQFVTDPRQTPNTRVKLAALNFIIQIAETADPSVLNNSAGNAFTKLLDWTTDVKSQDVRRQAQNAVIALYNLNPAQVTMILTALPASYQERVAPLLQNYLRKSSGSNPSSPGTPPPRSQQSPARIRIKNEIKSEIDGGDESLEDVYKSLRRTTAEIQNYGFERLERGTTSKDSGISNMADVEERLEAVTLSNSGRSSSVSSPTQRGRSVITMNGSSDTIAGDLILPQENNGFKALGTISDPMGRPEALENMIQVMQSSSSSLSEKAISLKDFQLYVRDGDPQYIKKNFKKVLKTLLDCLTEGRNTPKDAVLETLYSILQCPQLAENFAAYPELLVLKVINAYKCDEPKSESLGSGKSAYPYGAEKCAEAIATVLQPDQIIHLVSTIITTEPYPANMAAIKMLNKVVMHWGREAVEPHLSKLMPGLIKCYDDNESTVRKSAVFCMVAIHSAVGEEVLKPHLKALHASKLKLLYIYIQRKQHNREGGQQ